MTFKCTRDFAIPLQIFQITNFIKIFFLCLKLIFIFKVLEKLSSRMKRPKRGGFCGKKFDK